MLSRMRVIHPAFHRLRDDGFIRVKLPPTTYPTISIAPNTDLTASATNHVEIIQTKTISYNNVEVELITNSVTYPASGTSATIISTTSMTLDDVFQDISTFELNLFDLTNHVKMWSDGDPRTHPQSAFISLTGNNITNVALASVYGIDNPINRKDTIIYDYAEFPNGIYFVYTIHWDIPDFLYYLSLVYNANNTTPLPYGTRVYFSRVQFTISDNPLSTLEIHKQLDNKDENEDDILSVSMSTTTCITYSLNIENVQYVRHIASTNQNHFDATMTVYKIENEFRRSDGLPGISETLNVGSFDILGSFVSGDTYYIYVLYKKSDQWNLVGGTNTIIPS